MNTEQIILFSNIATPIIVLIAVFFIYKYLVKMANVKDAKDFKGVIDDDCIDD